MRKYTAIAGLGALLVFCLAAGAASAQLTDKQMAKLQKGDIITLTEKDPATGDRVSKGFVIFQAPRDLAWKVLTSYSEYPEFISEIKDLKVEKRDGAKLWVQINFQNLFPFPDFKCRAVINENPTSGAISLKMEDGDFEKYYSSWKLTSLDKNKVMAEYRLYKYVGWWWFPLVPNYLSNESQVGEYLNSFKKQVQIIQVQNSSQPNELIKPIWRKSIFKDKKKGKPAEQDKPNKEPKPDEKPKKLPDVRPEIRRPEH
jgi:ribosome-associated toxin RatA of RatAB toxin-antitoxin module